MTVLNALDAADLLKQIQELWIAPECAKRGLALADVSAAVVVMPPEGVPSIRLNAEASWIASVRARRAISAGEHISDEDADFQTAVVERPADVHADDGWVGYVTIGTTTHVCFDLRRFRGRSQELLDLATQYLELARGAAERRFLGPAVENAYAAAELAVRALMMVYGRDLTGHRPRQNAMRAWATLGNSPMAHSQALDRLAAARGASRYGDCPLDVHAEEVSELLSSVEGMVHSAQRARQ
jgi:uncharacterized protein (UPF0332 family)